MRPRPHAPGALIHPSAEPQAMSSFGTAYPSLFARAIEGGRAGPDVFVHADCVTVSQGLETTMLWATGNRLCASIDPAVFSYVRPPSPYIRDAFQQPQNRHTLSFATSSINHQDYKRYRSLPLCHGMSCADVHDAQRLSLTNRPTVPGMPEETLPGPSTPVFAN